MWCRAIGIRLDACTSVFLLLTVSFLCLTVPFQGRACDLFVSRQGSFDSSVLADSKDDKKALRMIHHACIFHDQ
jgi:hypothetical protein